jgi:hypothetical protein
MSGMMRKLLEFEPRDIFGGQPVEVSTTRSDVSTETLSSHVWD